MELYTFGRLALPVVVVIIGVAGGVTLFYGVGVLLRLIVFLRSLRQKQEKQQPATPIWVIAPRPALDPPMQERD